uniref:SID1 transmembrane family member 2 n=1 Tax=Strix occidentalis caurina TaxID=311401 RepID=A0A8D0EHV2_STROC
GQGCPTARGVPRRAEVLLGAAPPVPNRVSRRGGQPRPGLLPPGAHGGAGGTPRAIPAPGTRPRATRAEQSPGAGARPTPRLPALPQTEGVRVSVNVLSDHKDLPVLFVVRQKEAWRGRGGAGGRTLCQPQTKAEVETQHFYVDVSTLSLNASYQLRVTRVENFVLRTNERFSFNATAAQPQYFKYEFPEGVDSVIVKVTSAMAFPCSVISIQDILCPVYDLDNNVAFIGMYQTMTKKAAITVQVGPRGCHCP